MVKDPSLFMGISMGASLRQGVVCCVFSFFSPSSQGWHSHLAVHNLSVGLEPPNPLFFSLFLPLVAVLLHPAFLCPFPLWYELNHLLQALLWYGKHPLYPFSQHRRSGDPGRGTDRDHLPQELVLGLVPRAWLAFPLLSLAAP